MIRIKDCESIYHTLLEEYSEAYLTDNVDDEIGLIALERADERMQTIKQVLDMIDHAPTHSILGNWESMTVNEKERWRCTNCHAYVKMPTPYCPYCGSLMMREKYGDWR